MNSVAFRAVFGVPVPLVVSPLGANGSVLGPVSALAGFGAGGAVFVPASGFGAGVLGAKGSVFGPVSVFVPLGARITLPQEGQPTSWKICSAVIAME